MGRQSAPGIWRRLPALLAFPARPEVLGLITAYSAAHLLSFLLGSAITIEWLPNLAVSGGAASVWAALLGFAIELILLILGIKLAIESLLNTARDRLGEDKGGEAWASDDNAAGHFFLLVFFLLPTYLIALWFGTSIALWVLLLVFLCLPAAIILLTMDEHLWHAMNPKAWLALVGRLGGTYFLVVIALGLLALLVFGVQQSILSLLPEWIDAVLSRFIQLYAFVLAYHLMGQLLLSQSESLGLDTTPAIVRPVLANREEDAIMGQSNALLADGERAAAIEVLRALIHRHGASDPIHAHYRQLLVDAGDIAALTRHGREYVAVLLALGQEKRALALHVESRSLDPEFQLEVPEDITRLLSYAVASGQSRLAVELATGFDTRFPRNADVPQNMLVAAKLMAERLGREIDAKGILQGLAARYPEHPLTTEINSALASVDRLLQISPR